MNDLIVVPQQTQWHKLKAPVLDRASSPDHQSRRFRCGRGRKWQSTLGPLRQPFPLDTDQHKKLILPRHDKLTIV
jgi:hypothetical protein